ncbi:MAG: MBOAT family protein [Planctomycetales bacterium]|nr:MBOAT family protein [Planctomycetales bacterium]
MYCDFSAYSDIAIGSARVLGIDLMQNFNLPYMATSIADFWRRWHISLSTWFRDYVYFPLGGNRIDSQWLWARNVMVVFVVSGIWHGASWTYFVWGVLHGLYLVLGAWTRPVRARLADRLRIPTKVLWCWQVFVTFHLVLVSWVFFRARTVTDACRILWTMMTDWTGQLYLGPSQLATILAAALVALLLIVQLGQIRGWLPFYRSARKHGWYVRWPAYVTLILLIAMLGVTANDFIYFQF